MSLEMQNTLKSGNHALFNMQCKKYCRSHLPQIFVLTYFFDRGKITIFI